jgi:hypothetical protein
MLKPRRRRDPTTGVFTRRGTSSGHSKLRARFAGFEGLDVTMTIQSKFARIAGPRARDDSNEFLPYQLSTVV